MAEMDVNDLFAAYETEFGAKIGALTGELVRVRAVTTAEIAERDSVIETLTARIVELEAKLEPTEKANAAEDVAKPTGRRQR